MQDGISYVMAFAGNASQGAIFTGPTQVCERLLAELNEGTTTARRARALNRQWEEAGTERPPAAAICGLTAPETIFAKQICDSKKVSDHHAVIPTVSVGNADLALGEREIMKLVALGLLRAVSDAHRYVETTVTLACGGHNFTAKGRTVLSPGWKVYDSEKQEKDNALPKLTEGQTIPITAVSVKVGQTTPPKHYTEDTILNSMETAGAKDMPEDVERKGIGTPATRAAVLEKLVFSGFVERRKSKKVSTLIPSALGAALITVLPEALQSPLLTAEWEHRLKEVERGELPPEDFMESIAAMLRELI